MNAGELIKILEKLPDETKIRLSVFYDNCEHLQDMGNYFYFEDGNYILLRGKKDGG